MFKAHYNSMRPGPTPERVRAICRLLYANHMTEEEIKKHIYLEKSTAIKVGEEFTHSLEAAVELGLVSIKDGRYTLAVDLEKIATIDAFRRTVAKQAFSNRDSTFFRVSRWYMNANEAVFDALSWEDKAALANNALGDKKLNENDMLGWRFWASFLGLGYLYGTEIIPNMYLRVRDILATEFEKDFAFDEEVPAQEFLNWLWKKVPESRTEDESINLALSSAIRTLRDMDEMNPVFLTDAVPVYLYNVAEDATNRITHIIVKKEAFK